MLTLKRNTLLKIILSGLKISFIVAGAIFIFLCVLAFTPAPYWLRHWLGTYQSSARFTPDHIVMLGGSGMPSEDNLLRLYFVSECSKLFPEAEIILVHPYDTAVNRKMKDNLTNSGVAERRIVFEMHGANTMEQVKALALHLPYTKTDKLLIITSTEQMLRTVMTFRKAGFKNIAGCPTIENDMKQGLVFQQKLSGNKKLIPDIGDNLALRYNFWNYLKIEVTCFREFTALAYYRLMGWI